LVCRNFFHPLTGEAQNRTFCSHRGWVGDTCGCCPPAENVDDELCSQTGWDDEDSQLVTMALGVYPNATSPDSSSLSSDSVTKTQKWTLACGLLPLGGLLLFVV
jgi:hypothetical protein